VASRHCREQARRAAADLGLIAADRVDRAPLDGRGVDVELAEFFPGLTFEEVA
jgi:hypothetical protein